MSIKKRIYVLNVFLVLFGVKWFQYLLLTKISFVKKTEKWVWFFLFFEILACKCPSPVWFELHARILQKNNFLTHFSVFLTKVFKKTQKKYIKTSKNATSDNHRSKWKTFLSWKLRTDQFSFFKRWKKLKNIFWKHPTLGPPGPYFEAPHDFTGLWNIEYKSNI